MNKRVKHLLAACAAGLFLSQTAVALEGNPASGKAQSAPCAACHGKDGNSAAGNFPKLAGQHESYLLKQLKDIQSGERPVPSMAGQLDGKSEQQLADMAAFYAGKSITLGQADPKLKALGAKVYRAGIPEKGVPACSACHSPSGQGNGGAGWPRLSGQHAQYTADTLKAFRRAGDGLEGGRANDGDGKMMRTIALRMTDAEIEAVASFIQGLHIAQ